MVVSVLPLFFYKSSYFFDFTTSPRAAIGSVGSKKKDFFVAG